MSLNGAFQKKETFSLSLGIDPDIRIDYKPVTKIQTQSGLINKINTDTFIQVNIFVYNNFYRWSTSL